MKATKIENHRKCTIEQRKYTRTHTPIEKRLIII